MVGPFNWPFELLKGPLKGLRFCALVGDHGVQFGASWRLYCPTRATFGMLFGLLLVGQAVPESCLAGGQLFLVPSLHLFAP